MKTTYNEALRLFTFHLNCKYHPWELINDMQMSIYNRKHWHALSHSLHFVRHEGRLATISRTRLTLSMAADESGFYPPAAGLVVIAKSFNQDGRPMLTYWPTTLCLEWRRDLSQRYKCWGFVFLLLWSYIFESYRLVGFSPFWFAGFRSFCLTFGSHLVRPL